MKKRIRREILIETEQIAFDQQKKRISFSKCEICRNESVLLDPELIAERTNISTREIYRLIEANRVHFVEIGERKVFVCLNSLIELFD